jgi:hypothetical protein
MGTSSSIMVQQNKYIGLVWFNVTSGVLCGKTIDSAKLTLYPVTGCTGDGGIKATLLGSNSGNVWPENINYSEFSGYPSNAYDYNRSGNPFVVDIKSSVQATWADQCKSDFGIKLESSGGDGSFTCVFWSKDSSGSKPYLEIVYH